MRLDINYRGENCKNTNSGRLNNMLLSNKEVTELILQEMGIPDHLSCLLRNLYAGQEATARTGHGKMDWFQIGKGVCQNCILSPCLFNLYSEWSESEVAQLCPTLCDPVDYSPPGSSVHGILQARILERVAIFFSRMYIQSTSCEMPGWMNHKLESRLPGEISITSYMQMIPSYGRK